MANVEGAGVLAKEAIGMSIRENRVVRIVDEDGSQAVVLDEQAEGSAESGEEFEFWGTRDDGGEWRVHIVKGWRVHVLRGVQR